MSSGLPLPFPYKFDVSDDHNPGIRLYGKRFIKEQTVLENAVEFMAILFSNKWIGKNEASSDLFPSIEDLSDWACSSDQLSYKPPIKLNLKLFSFFGVTPFDSRHQVHQDQFRKIAEELENKIETNDGKPEEKVEILEQLLQGFQGIGFNRNWCAQTFFPISTKLLSQETIWNESIAKRDPISKWSESINRFRYYYSVSKHRFMARGGELLYLQLCNLFITDKNKIEDFVYSLDLNHTERDPHLLYDLLQDNFKTLKDNYSSAFEKLIDFIENLDLETHNQVNKESESQSCEWCPQESWREGLLFAVEMNRLMECKLDPVERLELFITGCSLQILRSLCAQSIRYSSNQKNSEGCGSVLGYSWIFTPTGSVSRQQRLASQRNLQEIQVLIQSALRNDLLLENAHKSKKDFEALLREADTRYGHKLFLYLGKRLGIIAPFKGPGARFIMTDEILRYLVLVLLRPGESCEYDLFLQKLYQHYGIAVEGEGLNDAVAWSKMPVNTSIQKENGSWLIDMLRASGFLTELSDGCSIVTNEFTYESSESRKF